MIYTLCKSYYYKYDHLCTTSVLTIHHIYIFFSEFSSTFGYLKLSKFTNINMFLFFIKKKKKSRDNEIIDYQLFVQLVLWSHIILIPMVRNTTQLISLFSKKHEILIKYYELWQANLFIRIPAPQPFIFLFSININSSKRFVS